MSVSGNEGQREANSDVSYADVNEMNAGESDDAP
jgi:hypothetical protein